MPAKNKNMDWKNILLIALAALLFFVWLPSIFMSVRNIWRSSNLKKTKNK